jgi:ribosomal protein S18 acetylase RimI-like enzyme
MNNSAEYLLETQAQGPLLASEVDYFRAGSRNITLAEGVLSIAEGFESLAAGCVLHEVDSETLSNAASHPLWADDDIAGQRRAALEKVFKEQKAGYFRCYLPLHSCARERLLFTHGDYARAVEVGLAARLADIEAAYASHRADSPGRLLPVRSTGDWQRKKQLYQSAPIGADGHDMQDGRFADFERFKCATGYMDSYLFMHHGICKGTISLAIKDRFARLKNLYLHPEFRNQGLGRLMIALALVESRRAGATMVGVYALENHASHALYRSLGLQAILRQVELCKPLNPCNGRDPQ